jgi:hypothetical protein
VRNTSLVRPANLSKITAVTSGFSKEGGIVTGYIAYKNMEKREIFSKMSYGRI